LAESLEMRCPLELHALGLMRLRPLACHWQIRQGWRQNGCQRILARRGKGLHDACEVLHAARCAWKWHIPAALHICTNQSLSH
jgi:hypothetical protein